MLVKVNTSLAGADFTFRFGEEVEQELFAAQVGNGWESLCDPVVENADTPEPSEVALDVPVRQVAVVPVAHERRGRRK